MNPNKQMAMNELHAKIAKLKSALVFYADPHNWEQVEVKPSMEVYIRIKDDDSQMAFKQFDGKVHFNFFGGSRAREAIGENK